MTSVLEASLGKSKREQAVSDIYYGWKNDPMNRSWKSFLVARGWGWSNPKITKSMQKNAMMDFERQMKEIDLYNNGSKLFSK